jgi:hypothetical protein
VHLVSEAGPPSRFPTLQTVSRVTFRFRNASSFAHLVFFLAAFAGASSSIGCRDRKPSPTYPLPDPVTAPPSKGGSGKSSSANRTTAGVASDRARESSTTPNSQSEIVWDRLGEWSGKGSVQTESFTGESGALRIKWQTRAIPGRPEGTFLLTIHSAISGRPLQVAVDQRGPGGDTAYVSEDPRVFFAVVEAADLEWSFEVAEPVGTRQVR